MSDSLSLSLTRTCKIALASFCFALWLIPDFNETVRNMIKGHNLLYMYVH